MKKPVIAITMSKGKDSGGYPRDFLPSAYAAAVRQAGGLPLFIPNDFPAEEINSLEKRSDGVLLSGGGDISPTLYNETEMFKLGNVRKERDAIEIRLAGWAIEKDLPLLGICRGHQLLNVACGGSLYQHVPEEHPSAIRHDTPESLKKDHLVHQVTVSRSSYLFKVLETETIEVNSRHHQAVKLTGKGLVVSALAPDQLIEAIELPGLKFCLGVQWHPENLQSFAVHRRIFEAFINAACG